MQKKLIILLALFISVIPGLWTLSLAQHNHGGGGTGSAMKMDTREVIVEGIRVTFQIMANEDHRKMLKDMKMKEDLEPGTTHNITLTLKDEKLLKEITDAKVSMKVVDPAGKDQIKTLKFEEMMKTYDGYFNLKTKGRYQFMVLMKQGNQKRTAGIYFEMK